MGQIGNKVMELLETIEYERYKKVCKDEIKKEIVSLKDIKEFFEKQRLVVPGAKKCMIAVNMEIEINPKGDPDLYLIRQIILDKDSKPIKQTENSYYGRTLRAKDISMDLVNFMNGEKKNILE